MLDLLDPRGGTTVGVRGLNDAAKSTLLLRLVATTYIHSIKPAVRLLHACAALAR